MLMTGKNLLDLLPGNFQDSRADFQLRRRIHFQDHHDLVFAVPHGVGCPIEGPGQINHAFVKDGPSFHRRYSPPALPPWGHASFSSKELSTLPRLPSPERANTQRCLSPRQLGYSSMMPCRTWLES